MRGSIRSSDGEGQDICNPEKKCIHLILTYCFLVISASKCQVTSLAVLPPCVYVGTTWGCLVVVDASTMRHLNVIRCHNDDWPYLQTILPLIPRQTSSAKQNTGNESEVGLITIGRGYRDLISQHINMADNKQLSKHSSIYVLGWQAGDWSSALWLFFIYTRVADWSSALWLFFIYTLGRLE